MGVFTPIPKIDGIGAVGVIGLEGDVPVLIVKIGESYSVKPDENTYEASLESRVVSEDVARELRQNYLDRYFGRRR
jgi:hypothetical protein